MLAIHKKRVPSAMKVGQPVFLLLLLLSAFPAASLAECDTLGGWYGDDAIGACYGLGALTDTSAPKLEMNWFEALDYCESVIPGKSFLANIKSQAAEDLIRSTLLGVGPECVWTSGNDLVSEGTFEWGFRTGDIVEYAAWSAGQPNNAVYCDIYFDEDCIDLRAAYQYEMNDVTCNYNACEPLCQYTP